MIKKSVAILLVSILAISCSGKSKNSEVLTSKDIKEEVKLGDTTVNFTFDSSELSLKAKRFLSKKVVPVLNNSNKEIIIEGHCDERGSEKYNETLGKERAKSVKKYLVLKGVSGYRIKTVSYGESKPLDSDHNEKAWAKNRRAITIFAK
jgi:peptidoglycan-associated lipoprotein